MKWSQRVSTAIFLGTALALALAYWGRKPSFVTVLVVFLSLMLVALVVVMLVSQHHRKKKATLGHSSEKKSSYVANLRYRIKLPADYSKVDAAISAGQIWRAKEILQGHIRASCYHSELYERYGRVLLEMGDLPEAGKYLFLSGAWKDNYSTAIDLFKAKHARTTIPNFYASLARGARQQHPEDPFPPHVLEAIDALCEGSEKTPHPRPLPERYGKKTPIKFQLGCVGGCLFVTALLLLGLWKLIEVLVK